MNCMKIGGKLPYKLKTIGNFKFAKTICSMSRWYFTTATTSCCRFATTPLSLYHNVRNIVCAYTCMYIKGTNFELWQLLRIIPLLGSLRVAFDFFDLCLAFIDLFCFAHGVVVQSYCKINFITFHFNLGQLLIPLRLPHGRRRGAQR